MNWKNRLTNYNFWISMFSAVLLILQALKIEFDVAYVNEIFTAVLGLLVVVGIIIDPTKTTTKTSNQTTKSEGLATQEKTAETTLPIDEKNEINNINNENDFQTTLKNMAKDLENKIKELDAINKDTVARLVTLQSEQTIALQHQNVVENKETAEPAVAEMENPYIDLMK